MFKITLNRIHDTVRITEGDESITLFVDADPMRIIAGLNVAQKRLQTITEETSDEDKDEISLYFAGVIFGETQAKELFDFYHEDSACLINVCGQYFSQRLAKLITKAQKKMKQ